MEYTLRSFTGLVYVGAGDTLRAAIVDALAKVSQVEFSGLAGGKAWCRRYVEVEVYRRKVVVFAAAANYDQVEMIEMMQEARDYRISGNAAAARYPLAAALATARGVTHQSVLTAWGNALQTAYGQLAALVHRQDQAETAISAAADLAALRDVMATILE